jgi:hypothetical protein
MIDFNTINNKLTQAIKFIKTNNLPFEAKDIVVVLGKSDYDFFSNSTLLNGLPSKPQQQNEQNTPLSDEDRALIFSPTSSKTLFGLKIIQSTQDSCFDLYLPL